MPVDKIRGSGKQGFLYQPQERGQYWICGKECVDGNVRSGTKLKIKVQKTYKEKFQKKK